MAEIEEEERIRREQIREIDMEELQIEEVDDAYTSSSSDDIDSRALGTGGADQFGDVTFDPCLVSIPSYFGEVDDNHHSVSFLDGGSILDLPMFYVEGVVLFPEATLPLRVTKPRFKASVERALNQDAAPGTIGVVHVHKDPDNERLCFSSVGTTAEIQEYRRLEDGSFNVLTLGKQRFHLRHRWIGEEGAPCAQVQIIQEDLPLRTPRDAFGQLASITNFWNCSSSCEVPSDASHAEYVCSEDNNDMDCNSETSFENDLSPAELQLHLYAIKSRKRYDRIDESTSSDSSQFASEVDKKLKRSCASDLGGSSEHSFSWRDRNDSVRTDNGYQSVAGKKSDSGEGWKVLVAAQSKWSRRAPKAFWPHWVYQMYDSYTLAQRAAAKWKQIIGSSSMDDIAKKPELLSFHIASKIPASESLRQELLEIDGVSYRLRREIELLECLNHVFCKTCQLFEVTENVSGLPLSDSGSNTRPGFSLDPSVIAKRSEMLAMSSSDPLDAFAEIPGYVHQIMTFYKANGLSLLGQPSEEDSWFQGYAWTATTCTICKSDRPLIGWLFTATNKTLKPDSFWAIRSSQVADNFC